MRLAFLGTPEAAVPTLEALVNADYNVSLVITQPDRRRSRGAELAPSPVKSAATALGIPVSHRLADLYEYDVERAVVVAYGVIIPQALLARVPMLNVHFSRLPRWRGAAPVERAILAGDTETGVTIISLEPTLDSGPVHIERSVRVGEKTARALIAELAALGAAALLEVLASKELLEHPRAQVGEATYAKKITKETLHLVPGMSTVLLLRTIRLGGAHLFVANKRVGVVSAHSFTSELSPGSVALVEGEVVLGTLDGAVTLDEVRPAGSSTMSAHAWWSGLRGSKDQLQWL
jgi:methionyl-tRNA formyltransferase